MKFIKLWIGDWQRDTAHLTASEEGIYLRLLLAIYATGKPIPADRVGTIARVHTRKERQSLDAILHQFFVFQDGVYENQRASNELTRADERSELYQRLGKLGGRPKKANRLLDENLIGSENESILKASHSQKKKKEEDITDLAFSGRVIRLSRADYDRWRKTFAAIPDLTAELEVADAYYAQNPPQRGWFFAVSAWLRKRHDEVRAKAVDHDSWN